MTSQPNDKRPYRVVSNTGGVLFLFLSLHMSGKMREARVAARSAKYSGGGTRGVAAAYVRRRRYLSPTQFWADTVCVRYICFNTNTTVSPPHLP
ncbi:hypothetical protein P167DRAFT_237205 [Morchella conica CCBAS932]|uniref:Uncharacterized protein n=1 Tax=Morchella conica CCBAS932 TaxID=1392247 RepID=A0A3N4KR97_9PEZI|nr:hypothetical protein P167DRAFT_237205 [Morchella conica CCBAS932]